MSQTTLQTEELAGFPASWFRPLLTKEQYERQATDYTKQQLKNASLYHQHTFHFFVLSVTQKLAVLWNRKVLYAALVVSALLVAFVLFGVFAGADPRHTEGGTLVPALTFSQRLAAVSFDVLEKIRQFTGQARKGLLLPEDKRPFGTAYASGGSDASARNPAADGTNSTHAIPLGNRNDEQSTNQRDYVVIVDTDEVNQKKTPHSPEEAASGETALVDSTGFSTFIRSQTYQGMNIFTFAFTVAKELAVSIFATAFGWSNGTAVIA